MTESSRSLDWHQWGREAFAQADADQKPVLLTVGAAWSLGCAEMLRTTYQDGVVRELVERHFIPVWVDADDRPDINDRYSLGGWPTTAFLTPDGQLLGGQTFTEPTRMAALLQQVASAYAARRTEFSEGAAADPSQTSTEAPRPVPKIDPSLDGWLVSHLRDAFDPAHGGFGRASKRIQESPLRLVLTRCRAGDTALRDVAIRTLDAIGGPLFDDVEGGVFRCAARRDWSQPQVEKLLSVNASALRLFLEGWSVFKAARYRQCATQLIRYVTRTLADDSNGGFFASQLADDVYYAATEAERGMLGSPPVDRMVYSGANAEIARAFVRGAELLDDSSLLECAVTALERVGETYQRGGGIAHRADDPRGVRGLLVDQIAVSEALYDAYSATDRDVYLDLAQELMLFAMRELWSARASAFVDRVVAEDDVGLLRQTITPFDLNCRAAHLLARLGRETDRSDFLERAGLALASQSASARRHSVDAASYVLALQDVWFSESS